MGCAIALPATPAVMPKLPRVTLVWDPMDRGGLYGKVSDRVRLAELVRVCARILERYYRGLG